MRGQRERGVFKERDEVAWYHRGEQKSNNYGILCECTNLYEEPGAYSGVRLAYRLLKVRIFLPLIIEDRNFLIKFQVIRGLLIVDLLKIVKHILKLKIQINKVLMS